jgi:hypothetical protein
MKPLSLKVRTETESLAKALLGHAKAKADKNGRIPVNDPDYAEAFGLLRGVLLATYGRPGIDTPIRLEAERGEATGTGRDWLNRLKTEVGIP